MASLSLRKLVIVPLLVSSTLAQSVNETVWASFAYVLNGERTVQSESPTLTPLGAQQLYSQGSLFKARYLSSALLSDEDNALTTNSPIAGIERQAINNDQLSIYSSTDSYVVGSALAFLQGLYPPTTDTFGSGNSGANESTLANGTAVDYPLGGYQYPNIRTVSSTDPNSVWVNGRTSCTEYLLSSNDFRDSEVGQQMYNSTLDFYRRTWAEVFPNTLPTSVLSFDYAYDLYEYAQYAYDHNETAREALNVNRLAVLRDLADKQQFDLNGNLSASGSEQGDMIRAVAGRTLAAKVVAQLSAHMDSNAERNKMTLMFGSFEPFLAFFALSNLSYSGPHSSLFQRIPEPGSAMVFELFSTGSDIEYPRESNTWVRFLYRNGTAADAPLTEYPLFGRGNSEARMRWEDFENAIDSFSIRSLSDWCNTCASVALFCSALTHSSTSSAGSGSGNSGGNGSGNATLSPAVAGVIGAITALGVIGLAGMTTFVFGGVRIRRKGPSGAARRRSSLGGFKGAEKMASDLDVSVARSGARHERVGSWELGNPGATVRTITIPPPVAATSEGSKTGVFGASIRRDAKDDDDGLSFIGASPVDPVERV